MAASSKVESDAVSPSTSARALLRFLGSLKLAVGLLVLLAAVLAVTTFVEGVYGRDFVRWYVYGHPWFAALLGVLAANILAAALVRLPWKKRHIAFLVTHAGLLVLLAGAIQSFMTGIEGRLTLAEGEVGDRILLHENSQFTIHWPETQSRQSRFPAAFVFKPGPVDWPEGKTLDLGEISGVHLRVVRYLPHARSEEDWTPDPAGNGPPAVKIALTNPAGDLVAEEWLVSGPFGARAVISPLSFEFHRATADTMLDDFLKPPAKDMDARGVLSVHYQGRMQRIPVGENLGKKVSLGESDAAVEIVEYFPNAKPGAEGKFTTLGDEPKNPLVELRIYLPDKKEPLRQIAFANDPFLNLDGVHGRTSPVTCWYHHPAVAPQPGIEFLQTADGKLHCRVAADGQRQPRGVVAAGDGFDLPGQFRAQVVRHLPHAKQLVSFHPVAVGGDEGGPEAAALLAVTAGGETQEVWLQRGNAEMGFRRVPTPEGPLALNFGYQYLPLGFSLKLLKFSRGTNPGGMGAASYTSTVHLTDHSRDVDEDREITMNYPLVHGKLAFYQSSYDEQPDGSARSILTVGYDPGRLLKYLGSAMICIGALLMSCRKLRFWKGATAAEGQSLETDEDAVLPEQAVPAHPHWETAADRRAARDPSGSPQEFTMRNSLAAFAVMLASGMAAFANDATIGTADLAPWRTLPVQDGGRYKPLDTLAWETCRMIGNFASLADPETGEKLDAASLYVSMLLDWREDQDPAAAQAEKPASPHAMPASPHGAMASPHGAGGGDPCAGAAMGGMTTRSSYFKLHKPDKWDEAPLILVESPEMRAALGMEAHQKRISPLALSQAEIEDPQAQAKTRFTVFVQRLAFRQGEGLSTFERNVMQVADRLWAYQEHRMGRKLAIVPLAGSESQEWLSAAHLLRAKFDERTDPTGELRKVQEQLQQVRTAYQGGSAEAFQSATAALFASLAEAGPQLGDYPATGPMTLEAAYNRWTPFRFAWVLTLLTCLGCTLSLATGWRPAYWGATAAFTAGLAAMLVGFAMRCVISGRAPVTNMYESVIYVGLGVAVFGLIMELVYRKQVILAAAAVLSTLALILADNCPVLLNPDLQPLNPILRNNYWLTTHVMSITLSYAAFALALGIGNVTLGYYLAGSRNQAAIDALSRFTYRTLQIGVVLLAVGTVLGGIWADYAWGRFWGWDPKEVWALISLLGYVSVLHAKHVNWVGQRGLAALAVGCFSLVIIAWYGVNFIIGTGLHSYGFGSGGGQFYVGGALLAQFLYVGVAVLFGRQESLAALPPTRPSLHLRRPSGAREPVAASQLD